MPSPVKMGRKLYLLKPARPGTQAKVLLDAGRGAIGTPRVSFDGRWLYLAMAKDGELFFHIYRMGVDGSGLVRLTDGPFHDIDPCELPDGRIVFTSTRIGMFDEYHNPPARALFVMNADGTEIRSLTHTFVFDNEPQVMADGRIVFIRSDNFFDRGKVETLLHAIHPDGTEGYTEFGLDNGPEYGGRLRAFYCGSPAPLDDGQVAFVSSPGITVGRPGTAAGSWRHFRVDAGDVAATTDGRLVCTVAKFVRVELEDGKKGKRTVNDARYEKLALIDPRQEATTMVTMYESAEPIHSPVCIGERVRPPLLPEKVDTRKTAGPGATGVLVLPQCADDEEPDGGVVARARDASAGGEGIDDAFVAFVHRACGLGGGRVGAPCRWRRTGRSRWRCPRTRPLRFRRWMRKGDRS